VQNSRQIFSKDLADPDKQRRIIGVLRYTNTEQYVVLQNRTVMLDINLLGIIQKYTYTCGRWCFILLFFWSWEGQRYTRIVRHRQLTVVNTYFIIPQKHILVHSKHNHKKPLRTKLEHFLKQMDSAL
jgi:hypothetical protein